MKHDKKYLIERGPHNADVIQNSLEASKMMNAIKNEGKGDLMMKIAKYTAVSIVLAFVVFMVIFFAYPTGW